MRKVFKFYKYIFASENYLLLTRAIGAASLVRRYLKGSGPSPLLSSSFSAVDRLYLPPQKNWEISDAAKIADFANFVVNFPVAWGKCVHQSLIVYRLLNGYGIPAKICFGVSKDGIADDGHAWVETEDGIFAERIDPRERFQTVFTSSRPEFE